MIVKPTVNDLLKHAENRFALVIGTSKRARQIANGDTKLTNVDETSPVTIAANEINEGKVIISDEESQLNTDEEVVSDTEEQQENNNL